MHEEPRVGFDPHLHEVLQAGHQFTGEDEHELSLHEEVPLVGCHFDLNMNPDEHEADISHGEEEHEADVAHGEDHLHESDESDDELEDQGGFFQSMEEEVHAMDEALDNLHVDLEDYGVYAGDIEIQFDEEELDDSEPHEAMYDSAPDEDMDVEQEQEDNEQVHDEDKHKNLTYLQRTSIYEELLARSVGRRLKKTTTREVANMFQV